MFTLGRKHVSCCGERPGDWIVQFRGAQGAKIVTPGDQNAAIRQQGRRRAGPCRRHVAGCCEHTGGWVEELCAGSSTASDQHLAVQERGRRMANAGRAHIARWQKRAVSLCSGCEGPAEEKK